MTNSLDEHNSRLDSTNEKMSKLDKREIQIEHKEKKC